MVKLEITKTMLKILPFIRILYPERFCSLKFEKSLCSNKFFSFMYRIKMTVHTAEKDQIKYFAQN